MSARYYALYFNPALLEEEAPLARFIAALTDQDFEAAWELVEDVADGEDIRSSFDGRFELEDVEGAVRVCFDTRCSVGTDFVLELLEALDAAILEGWMENSQSGETRWWLDGKEVQASAPFRWVQAEPPDEDDW